MKPPVSNPLSFPSFFQLLSAGLFAACLIVAFAINRIDPPAFAPEFPLPWDPTHTGLKYLVLAFLVLAGAFAWRRYQPDQGRIALLPALLLTVAVPLGAAGYESVSSDWGWTAWMESNPEKMAELRRDPYAYFADPEAEVTMIVLIRDDTLQLGRLTASIAGDDPGGLQAKAERKASMRTWIGWGLLFVAAGLIAGAGWLIRQTRIPTTPSTS